MWKNIVERGRTQIAIWRMHIACWIPKAADRHSEYVIHFAFQLPQWLQEGAPMLHYVYNACLILF